MPDQLRPILFIHGLWLHASSWTPWVEKFRAAGYAPVAPENPYWIEHGVTFEDPDGWRLVLMNTAGLSPDDGDHGSH